MAVGNPKKQHVVSEVVLGKFARDGRVLAYDLTGHKEQLKSPSAVCYRPDFVSWAPIEAERLWQETENVLKPALEKAANGAVLAASEVELVKRCIALHFARSDEYRELHQTVMTRTMEQQRRDFLQHAPHLIDRAGRDRYGELYFPSTAWRNFIMDQVHDIPWLKNGQLFWSRLLSIYQKATTYVLSLPLVVGQPEEGELLLGDDPVLALRQGQDGTGPLQGIGLMSAEALAMPIGPKALAILDARAREGVPLSLGRTEVDKLNVLQIEAARRHVVYRPGSGLGQLVQDVLDASSMIA